MTPQTIISIVMIALLAIAALYFLLRGLHRGWVKALMTTGNIALSAFLACFLSRDFTTIARDYVYPLFLWISGLFGFYPEQALADFEEIIALLPLFAGVILTPFLFLIFFWIFRTVIGFALLFVYRPKRKVVNEEGETVKVKRHVPVWSRVLGAVIGVCNGALLLAVMLVPIGGYVNMAVHVGDAYFEGVDTSGFTRDGKTPNEVIYYAMEDYVEPISNDTLMGVAYNTVGKPMFTHMTTTAYHEAEFNLETEAKAAIKLLRDGVKFAKADFTKMDAQSVKDLHGLVDLLDESVLMPELMASAIAGVSDNWAEGQPMFGIPRPEMGELLDPTFNVLLHILSTVDRETLVADLNTLVDFLDLLVHNGILESLEDSNRMMDNLSKNPDMVDEMMDLFEKNEHMKPMALEIKRLCIRAVTSSLDMENAELTGELTDTVNQYKDEPEQLSQALNDVVHDYLKDQNIEADISTEMTDQLAEAISREFAEQDEVTEDEIVDFVLNYASQTIVDENGNIDIDDDGIMDGHVDDVLG